MRGSFPSWAAQAQAFALGVYRDPRSQPEHLIDGLLRFYLSATPTLQLQWGRHQGPNPAQTVILEPGTVQAGPWFNAGSGCPIIPAEGTRSLFNTCPAVFVSDPNARFRFQRSLMLSEIFIE
jgi:hypothetical protein